VCGERAGNVAILHIVPRRFCFRSHPRSFSAPPPFCLVGSSLFRESSSRQECARTLSSAMVRQRGVMYDLTVSSFSPLLFLSLSLSLSFSSLVFFPPARASSRQILSTSREKSHARARFLRTVRVRMDDIAV